MVIFDQFCRCVDKALKSATAKKDLIILSLVAGALRHGAIFEFTESGESFLPKEYTKEQAAQMYDLFFLPFLTVIVIDKDGVTIIMDTDKRAQGLGCRRFWLDYMPDPFESDGAEATRLQALIGERPKGARALSVLSYGAVDGCFIDAQAGGTKLQGRVKLSHLLGFDSESASICFSFTGAEYMKNFYDRRDSPGRNAMVAVQEIWYSNRPDKFIVERTPRHVRKVESPKIPRLYERSTYRILDSKQAVRLIHPDIDMLSNHTGKKLRSGHPRARHFRTLRSDKFVHAQGKTIIVSSTWVGPQERTDSKGVRYKVRLDV